MPNRTATSPSRRPATNTERTVSRITRGPAAPRPVRSDFTGDDLPVPRSAAKHPVRRPVTPGTKPTVKPVTGHTQQRRPNQVGAKNSARNSVRSGSRKPAARPVVRRPVTRKRRQAKGVGGGAMMFMFLLVLGGSFFVGQMVQSVMTRIGEQPPVMAAEMRQQVVSSQFTF